MKGNKRISAFNNPLPTKGSDIQEFEALNSKYAVWDLGGQKSYQDEYFIDFKKYLKDMKVSMMVLIMSVYPIKGFRKFTVTKNQFEILILYTCSITITSLFISLSDSFSIPQSIILKFRFIFFYVLTFGSIAFNIVTCFTHDL